MNPEAKAKMLELVSKAIDKGAHISIQFHQFDNNKPVLRKDVVGGAAEIANALFADVEDVENEVANHLLITNDDIRLTFCYLTPDHKDYKEGK